MSGVYPSLPAVSHVRILFTIQLQTSMLLDSVETGETSANSPGFPGPELIMLPSKHREEGRVRWNTPVAPELRTQKEEDLRFEVSLDYIARLPLLQLFFILERSSPYVALDLGF